MKGGFPDCSWLLAFALSLIAVVVVGAVVAEGVHAHRFCSPNFDEAVHLLPVAQAVSDLRSLDFVSFWRHSYEQNTIAQYPFFHSWLLSPFFVFLPFDLTAGRVANVVLVCLSVVMSFFLAGELSPREDLRWLSGLVGMWALLSALPLWVYGSRAYLEPAGLLITLLVLLCYVKAEPGLGRWSWWAVCSSLLLAAGFLTKYSFGLFLLGGLILAEGLGQVMMRRGGCIRWLCLFGPCAALILAWLANPEKLAGLLAYSRAQDPNMELWSVRSLTYYLHSMSQLYIATPLVLTLVLLGAGYAVSRIREHRYRALLSYLVVSLVMVTLVPQKHHRFIYTIAPVALVLGGVGAVWATARLLNTLRLSALRHSIVVLMVLLLCLDVWCAVHRFSFLSEAQDVIYACPPADIQRAYRFVLDHTLDMGVKPYIVNFWHRFNQYGLLWEHYAKIGMPQEGELYHLAAAGLAPAPTPENLDRLVRELREQNIGVLVSIDGSPAGDYTGWQVVEPLWARGDVDWIASSEPFTIATWSSAYEERVLSGDFRGRADLEAAKREGWQGFSIQLHLYAVTPG